MDSTVEATLVSSIVVDYYMGVSLTGDGSCPGRDEFAVDQPADENEACAAEGVGWLCG